MNSDRYAGDVLRDFGRRRPASRERIAADPGVVVEHTESEWCGAVVSFRQGVVELEDFRGRVRGFPVTDGFLVDGVPVELGPPTPAPASAARTRTASGSFAVAPQRARVAMPSRIFVEGRHDAELVEKVWGDDLRVEGVVVELLEGVDHLERALADFGPGPGRRAGVLVDHLVPGSKESRLIQATVRGALREHVLVVGHPYVDVWQSVRPERLGLTAWPVIPRTIEWKRGICQHLGWPAETQADVARAWQRILGRVDSFSDLEPSLLGRVEELIDFVTDSAEH